MDYFTYTKAVYESEMTAKAKALCLCVAYHYNWSEKSPCWPSDATLASETGLAPATLRRGKREAEAAGFLHSDRRYDSTSLYTPLIPDEVRSQRAEGALTVSGGPVTVTGGSAQTERRVRSQRATNYEYNKEKNNEENYEANDEESVQLERNDGLRSTSLPFKDVVDDAESLFLYFLTSYKKVKGSPLLEVWSDPNVKFPMTDVLKSCTLERGRTLVDYYFSNKERNSFSIQEFAKDWHKIHLAEREKSNDRVETRKKMEASRAKVAEFEAYKARMAQIAKERGIA